MIPGFKVRFLKTIICEDFNVLGQTKFSIISELTVLVNVVKHNTWTKFRPQKDPVLRRIIRLLLAEVVNCSPRYPGVFAAGVWRVVTDEQPLGRFQNPDASLVASKALMLHIPKYINTETDQQHKNKRRKNTLTQSMRERRRKRPS